MAYKNVCVLVLSVLLVSSAALPDPAPAIGVWVCDGGELVAYRVRLESGVFWALAPDGEFYAVAGAPDYVIRVKP
jgi:hypothetical protein